MRLADYRSAALVRRLAGRIGQLAGRLEREYGRLALMEVCGTHTMAVGRHGLRALLPSSLRLLSGPGCPVCVTSAGEIDGVLEIARRHDVLVATFGDMFRVPGSRGSLEAARASGADVRVVYSPLEAVELAAAEPHQEVVFLGVGFETTAPAIAAALKTAREKGLRNWSLLPLLKTIPPALCAVLAGGQTCLHGLLLPGHVSAVIGSLPYEFIPRQFDVPSVIAGFEPVDVFQAIVMLLEQLARGQATVEIAYRRAVRPQGNPHARRLLEEVFVAGDAEWRGLGNIPASGLRLAPDYADFDARQRFPVAVPPPVVHPDCLCGKILAGAATPADCLLFGAACTPERPIGPCMVSAEGTCAAHYQYGAG